MIPRIEEYLSAEEVEALMKIAYEERPEHPVTRGLKTLGTSVGGMVLGAGAGLGAAYGAEKLLGKKMPMRYVVPAAAVLGMGAGLAETAMREKQMQEMRDAIKKYKARPKRSR